MADTSSPPPAAPDPALGPDAGTVTRLLQAWGAGDPAALDALVPTVYDELRRIAARAMRRESVGHTLQPTALVGEAYLRLVDQRRVQWRNRAQFFGLAAQLMRRLLVDHARARQAAKRGGARAPLVTLADGTAGEAATSPLELLALHDALARLGAMDPQLERLVEARYFGGLTIEETAEALGVSPATVKRDWVVARAWLRRALLGSDEPEAPP